MTTEQRFLAFINQVDEFLKAQDKADSYKTNIFIQDAVSKRRELKIAVAKNRLVPAVNNVDPVKKSVTRKRPNQYNFNQSYLGR